VEVFIPKVDAGSVRNPQEVFKCQILTKQDLKEKDLKQECKEESVKELSQNKELVGREEEEETVQEEVLEGVLDLETKVENKYAKTM
jgi:hypothetical protein